VTEAFRCCRRCDTRLIGTATCHCTSCCDTFARVVDFDAHRVNGKCRRPSGLKMTRDARGYWQLPK